MEVDLKVEVLAVAKVHLLVQLQRVPAPVKAVQVQKTNSTTSSTKSVNTKSKALSSIPSSYSSHSVSNSYYYNVDWWQQFLE